MTNSKNRLLSIFEVAISQYVSASFVLRGISVGGYKHKIAIDELRDRIRYCVCEFESFLDALFIGERNC